MIADLIDKVGKLSWSSVAKIAALFIVMNLFTEGREHVGLVAGDSETARHGIGWLNGAVGAATVALVRKFLG